MKIADRLDAALGAIGAVVIFSMMALTFVDVVLRYVFNASLRGAFEVTELLMVVLIYAGLPLVSRQNQHVTTDLLDPFLSGRLRHVSNGISQSICAAALFGASYLIWIKAGRAAQLRDVSASLGISLAPFAYLMCVLIAITALIHLMKVFLPRDAETTDAPGSAL